MCAVKPKRSRSGPVSAPDRVVAPTRGKGVDEEHVVLDQVGQHRGQVACAFERGPGRHPQRRPQLGGDDHGQRRLAQPRWTGQQDVIRCAAAVFGPLDDQLQLFAHPRLTDELVQRARPQAAVDVALPRRQGAGDLAIGVVLLEVVRAHRDLPSKDRAARRAAGVVASCSAANTLSVASSACLAAKPSPIRASTTGPRTACPLSAAPAGAPPGAVTAPTLSRNSSTIRSAPRLPIPGTRVSAATSLSCSACRSAAASCTASVAIASRGPTPDTESSVRNRSRVSVSLNPYNVMESSRTTIAVISLASVPVRSVASVDG